MSNCQICESVEPPKVKILGASPFYLLSGPWDLDGRDNFAMDQELFHLKSGGIVAHVVRFEDKNWIYRTARGWKNDGELDGIEGSPQATHALPYSLRSPDGKIHEGMNLSELARKVFSGPDIKLASSQLSKLRPTAKRRLKSWRGWTWAG